MYHTNITSLSVIAFNGSTPGTCGQEMAICKAQDGRCFGIVDEFWTTGKLHPRQILTQKHIDAYIVQGNATGLTTPVALVPESKILYAHSDLLSLTNKISWDTSHLSWVQTTQEHKYAACVDKNEIKEIGCHWYDDIVAYTEERITRIFSKGAPLEEFQKAHELSSMASYCDILKGTKRRTYSWALKAMLHREEIEQHGTSTQKFDRVIDMVRSGIIGDKTEEEFINLIDATEERLIK